MNRPAHEYKRCKECGTEFSTATHGNRWWSLKEFCSERCKRKGPNRISNANLQERRKQAPGHVLAKMIREREACFKATPNNAELLIEIRVLRLLRETIKKVAKASNVPPPGSEDG